MLLAQNLMNYDESRRNQDFSNPFWVQEKEFRIYSQFVHYGIIQWLIYKLGFFQPGAEILQCLGMAIVTKAIPNFTYQQPRFDLYQRISRNSSIKRFAYYRHRIR